MAVSQPPLALGYVSCIGVVLVAPLSMWTAPLGVRLAYSLSKTKLELAFGLFQLLVCLSFLVTKWRVTEPPTERLTIKPIFG